MATFGLGMVGFFRSLQQSSPSAETIHLHQAAVRFGEILVVIGILALLCSAVAHWLALRRLRRDEAPSVSLLPLSVTLASLLAVLGLVMLWGVVGR